MLENNKINLIISILAAIAIWVYVVGVINPSDTRTIRNVPVTLTNVESLQERDLAIVDDNEYTIDVSISGKRSVINQVNVNDIDATANLFGYPEGENKIRVAVDIQEDVKVDSLNPSHITVVIDELVMESKPITIKYQGDFNENTEPGFVSMVPEAIEVSGAKSLVNKVSHVEATVNSDEVKDEETTIDANVRPVNKNGNVISGVSLSQKNVEITLTMLHSKTVPLEVETRGNVASSYEVTAINAPTNVSIVGVKSQLDGISKITASPINISNITETTEVPLKFNFPSKVKLSEKSENISAIIEINNITKKTFLIESSNVKINGISDEHEASIEDSTIRVSVFGSASLLSNLSDSDFVLSVDISEADFSESKYLATLVCSVDEEVKSIVIDPKEVEVIIKEKE